MCFLVQLQLYLWGELENIHVCAEVYAEVAHIVKGLVVSVN